LERIQSLLGWRGRSLYLVSVVVGRTAMVAAGEGRLIDRHPHQLTVTESARARRTHVSRMGTRPCGAVSLSVNGKLGAAPSIRRRCSSKTTPSRRPRRSRSPSQAIKVAGPPPRTMRSPPGVAQSRIFRTGWTWCRPFWEMTA
jgi:hypothetical protein